MEWFYDIKKDRYFHAGDMFKLSKPNFDDKQGTQHNLKDLYIIFDEYPSLDLWLADMALFYALIGNSDRHQDNWGVVIKESLKPGKCVVLSPLFDNGTSLGHEHSPEKAMLWDQEKLEKYIKKCCHHLRHNGDEPKNRISHLNFIKELANKVVLKNHIFSKIEGVRVDAMSEEISSLTEIKCDQPFAKQRNDWVIRLLRTRFNMLKENLSR